jgi:hypothetical protein
MKIIVYYTDLIWDNYQGGSGKVVNSKMIVELRGQMVAEQTKELIQEAVLRNRHTIFKQDDKPIITKMELL